MISQYEKLDIKLPQKPYLFFAVTNKLQGIYITQSNRRLLLPVVIHVNTLVQDKKRYIKKWVC